MVEGEAEDKKAEEEGGMGECSGEGSGEGWLFLDPRFVRACMEDEPQPMPGSEPLPESEQELRVWKVPGLERETVRGTERSGL